MTAARRLSILAKAAGVALALLACANSARAQEGPVVVGQRQQMDAFKFQSLETSLEGHYYYNHNQISSSDGTSSSSTENRFEETLNLLSNGYIIHPNFAEFTLNGDFGLRQDNATVNGDDASSNTLLYDYDASATFLRKEIAPVTVYSRRSEDTVSRNFGPTLDSTLQTSGVIWNIQSKTVPTRLEYYHTDQTETGLAETGPNSFSLGQDVFTWYSEYRPTQNQLLTWNYNYSHVDQQTEGFPPNNFETHDATLAHSVQFGKDNRSSLNSSVEYFKQTGDYDLERFHWNEILRLHHSDSLETHYRYSFDQQTLNGERDTTNSGEIGFTHQLYQSLTTTGNAGIRQFDRSDGGNTFEWYTNLNFDYRKNVPLGTFTSFLRLVFDQQHNDQISSPIQVIDSRQVFNDPYPIILTGRNIAPTVTMTDTTGTIPYYENIDYTIIPSANGLVIDRDPNGNILPGQTVLIDYTLNPQASNTVNTSGFALGGRYDIEQGWLKGVGVYARYQIQNQSIDSQDPNEFIPDNFTDVTFGADYRIWNFKFGAEREIHDSDLFPFDSNRFYARYAQRLAEDTILSVDANFIQVHYPDANDTDNLLTVLASLDKRFGRQLTGSASILWRDERDDLRGHIVGLEEQFQLQWQHRQTSVYIRFRNTNYDGDSFTSDAQYFELGLTREF